MSKLFEPFTINKLEIKNRFVRSATVDNLGKDKLITQAQLDFYREMVLGEMGLIISSGLFPSQDGWAAPGQVGIHHDDQIPSLKKLTDNVHKYGGKVAAQLNGRRMPHLSILGDSIKEVGLAGTAGPVEPLLLQPSGETLQREEPTTHGRSPQGRLVPRHLRGVSAGAFPASRLDCPRRNSPNQLAQHHQEGNRITPAEPCRLLDALE